MFTATLIEYVNSGGTYHDCGSDSGHGEFWQLIRREIVAVVVMAMVALVIPFVGVAVARAFILSVAVAGTRAVVAGAGVSPTSAIAGGVVITLSAAMTLADMGEAVRKHYDVGCGWNNCRMGKRTGSQREDRSQSDKQAEPRLFFQLFSLSFDINRPKCYYLVNNLRVIPKECQ